jgi:hypothetical protein
MTTETDAVISTLQAICKEFFPSRDPQAMRITDTELMLGVMFRRELAKKIDRLPARYAEGAEPQHSVRSSGYLEGID